MFSIPLAFLLSSTSKKERKERGGEYVGNRKQPRGEREKNQVVCIYRRAMYTKRYICTCHGYLYSSHTYTHPDGREENTYTNIHINSNNPWHQQHKFVFSCFFESSHLYCFSSFLIGRLNDMNNNINLLKVGKLDMLSIIE